MKENMGMINSALTHTVSVQPQKPMQVVHKGNKQAML